MCLHVDKAITKALIKELDEREWLYVYKVLTRWKSSPIYRTLYMRDVVDPCELQEAQGQFDFMDRDLDTYGNTVSRYKIGSGAVHSYSCLGSAANVAARSNRETLTPYMDLSVVWECRVHRSWFIAAGIIDVVSTHLEYVRELEGVSDEMSCV